MSIGEEEEDRSRMKGIYQRSNLFFIFRFEILGGCLQRAGDTMWRLAIGYSSDLTPAPPPPPPAVVSARGRWLSGTL